MSKPPVRPYYTDKGASTAFYDLVTEADKSIAGDIDLYAGLVPPGGTVLELGAGTGRIALSLAQRGFRVTGLDIAPAMLAQAKIKRAGLGSEVAERVKFVKADMTAFDLGRAFDAVICTFYTMSHLPPGPRWERTFKAISRHLAPGGVAAVHLPLEAQMRATPPPPTKPVLLQQAPEGKSLVLYVDSQTFSGEGRMDLVLRYVVSGPSGVREPGAIDLFPRRPRPIRFGGWTATQWSSGRYGQRWFSSSLSSRLTLTPKIVSDSLFAANRPRIMG